MNQVEKLNNPIFDEFIMKFNVGSFGCSNLLQDFNFMKNVNINSNNDGCLMKKQEKRKCV